MPISSRRAATPLCTWSSSTACSARRRRRQEGRQVGDVVAARGDAAATATSEPDPERASSLSAAASAARRATCAATPAGRAWPRAAGRRPCARRPLAPAGSIVITERSPSASSTTTSRTIACSPLTRTDATWPRRRRSRGTSVERPALGAAGDGRLEERARARAVAGQRAADRLDDDRRLRRRVELHRAAALAAGSSSACCRRRRASRGAATVGSGGEYFIAAKTFRAPSMNYSAPASTGPRLGCSRARRLFRKSSAANSRMSERPR